MKKLLPEAIVISAILLVVSYGFAQNWTKTRSSVIALSMAVSADGQTIMSVGSDAVISTNGGATLTSLNLVYDFDHIASSADGTKVIAVRPGTFPVYFSKDSGNTWSPTGSPSKSSQTCAISADGNKLFAAANGGLFYYSTNFGSNWYFPNPSSKAWTCLPISRWD